MRRLFTVLIIAFVAFWVIYGLVGQFRNAVNGVMIGIVGPAFYSFMASIYNGIIANLGVGGFVAIILGFGFMIGIVAHFLWVRADWSIRRWGASRTAKELGVTPVTSVRSTTPSDATTRPETPTENVVVEETEKTETKT